MFCKTVMQERKKSIPPPARMQHKLDEKPFLFQEGFYKQSRGSLANPEDLSCVYRYSGPISAGQDLSLKIRHRTRAIICPKGEV